MSEETDALVKSLHHAGLNVDRTTLGVVRRELNKRGYDIAPVAQPSTPQFHVQPAVGVMTQGGGGGPAGYASKGSTKEGSGRV